MDFPSELDKTSSNRRRRISISIIFITNCTTIPAFLVKIENAFEKRTKANRKESKKKYININSLTSSLYKDIKSRLCLNNKKNIFFDYYYVLRPRLCWCVSISMQSIRYLYSQINKEIVRW